MEREVYEETGIKCKAVKKLGQRHHPVTGKDMVYWLCNYLAGEPSVASPTEVEEVIWLNREVAIKKLGPTLFDVIRDFLSKEE